MDRAFKNKGNFEELASSWSVPQKIRQEITNGHPKVQTHLASGISRLVTENYKAYRNGDDVVEMADFKLLTNYQKYEDPILVIHEAEDGRTSRLVRDFLMNELKVSIIESTIKNGMQHQETRNFFDEIASMTGNPFENIYNKTMNDMIASMRTSLDAQTQRLQHQMQEQRKEIQRQRKQMRERNY